MRDEIRLIKVLTEVKEKPKFSIRATEREAVR